MKTVTRSLLLSYSPISSDQLVELYCRRAKVVVAMAILYIAMYLASYSLASNQVHSFIKLHTPYVATS